MAQRSTRRVGIASNFRSALSAEKRRGPDLELHTGQRRVYGRINRPDTRKHLDYARTSSSDSSCILGGVHTRKLAGCPEPDLRMYAHLSVMAPLQP
jgi:hypothetical protein